MFKKVNPKQNFAELEENILKFWQENKIFGKSIKTRPKSKSYVFYDGPPFATGLPHYGHILASTVKDVVPRYWTMKGFRVERKWGWDCHGLPIENLIEKELGLNSRQDVEKYGIDKFNQKARQAVLKYDKAWEKIISRVGRWVDFKNSYKTMDNSYIESVWWAFKELYKKGLFYQGQRSSLYCPRCSTPLSKFEIAMDNSYKIVTEQAVYVKFKIKDAKLETILLNQKSNHESFRGKNQKVIKNSKLNIYFLVWTTTPWTLPANVGLAVNNRITYILAENFKTKEVVIMATDRLKVLGEENYNILAEIKGKDLVGLEYEPQFGKSQTQAIKEQTDVSENLFKVWSGDFVNTDEGTGIVHIASGYGEDDFDLAKKNNIPIFIVLDEAGKFNIKDNQPNSIYKELKGVYFKKVNKLVKDRLGELLFKTASVRHNYPFC